MIKLAYEAFEQEEKRERDAQSILLNAHAEGEAKGKAEGITLTLEAVKLIQAGESDQTIHEKLGIALDMIKVLRKQIQAEEKRKALKERCDTLLNEDSIAQQKKGKSIGTLCSEQRKVLKSLQNHWPGLIVFYEHPEVKMDNNPAEESLRNPVLGRNAYYGSGSLDSAELAAMLFSIFRTLLL